MFPTGRFKNYRQPKMILLLTLVLTIGAGLIVFARTRGKQGPYSLAGDVPRGALVYAQFKDLPALLRQWDQSTLKQQYLASASYAQFQHRHLALKLIERWTEFNDGLGFELDTASLGEATDAGAAIAIYDIGRLDLVFVAPLSEEKLALTRFFKSKAQFEEHELPDGTSYYRHDVEADRGRQKQVLAFATIKGRFVLATSERLLLQTIATIKQPNGKDRLADDPAFQTLAATVAPHFATIWVDQAKLNDDWYFKHYWVMQNPAALKDIRACMFDLEMQEGKWIERRDFLTAPRKPAADMPAAEAQRLRALLPEGLPFLKVQSLKGDRARAANLIRDQLFDRVTAKRDSATQPLWSWQSYGEDQFYAGDEENESDSESRYHFLNADYDAAIDDRHDAGLTGRESPGPNPLSGQLDAQFLAGVGQALGAAQPLWAAVATNPRPTNGPLFVEFQRVAIVTLQEPANLRVAALESAIQNAVQGRLTAAGANAELQWASRTVDSHSWRELAMPLLGWKLCYALRDHELILANSPELLAQVLATHDQPAAPASPAALDDLTVIRLDQRQQAFDGVLGKLDALEADARRNRQKSNPSAMAEASPTPQFFSGEIGSLLDVSAGVKRIEIRRSSTANRLHEELDFVLR